MIDYTDGLMSDEKRQSYIGESVYDLIEDGFEGNGWSVYDDVACVYLSKNGVIYRADITLAEEFDEEADVEFEDFYEAIVDTLEFEEVESWILPIE